MGDVVFALSVFLMVLLPLGLSVRISITIDFCLYPDAPFIYSWIEGVVGVRSRSCLGCGGMG